MVSLQSVKVQETPTARPTSSLSPDAPQRLTEGGHSEAARRKFLLSLTAGNGAFSEETPGLQLVWDSSSLTPLMTCQYLYYLKNICGWVPHGNHRSVHLIFGILYTSGCEEYDKARAAGEKHRPALRAAVRRVLRMAGERQEDGTWLSWNSPDPNKNLPNCVRTLILYLDSQKMDKSISTVQFADGSAAVEKRFAIGLPFSSEAGEEFTLCGYLDRIVKFGAEKYIADHKTTKGALDDRYFKNFDYSLQMYVYSLAGRIAFDEEIKGVLIEGAQAAVGFSSVKRGMSPRNDYQLAQLLPILKFWTRVAETCAKEGYWAKNYTACTHYGGCDYRDHCHAKHDKQASAILRSKFKRASWDPTRDRED